VIAVDTNVLVYAHREEAPHYEEAHGWLRGLAEGTEPWGLPVFVLGEFVRVVTHPKVFDPPTPLEEALANISGLLESPAVRLLRPGARYWGLLEESAKRAQAHGNLLFDAQIVALCREQGVERILSEDRDFARFPEIELVTLAGRGA
jgi:toxin-antitoxin system PIN domain toxin